MFQATRRRLAIWYTMVTAVLLLLFASGFYGYVRLTLIDRIDDTLNHVVEVLERSFTKSSDINSFINDDLEANLEEDRIDLEWFSADGELLWTTMPRVELLPLKHSRSYDTVYLPNQEPVRQITEPVEVDHRLVGYLRVSHPWFEFTKPINQLLTDLTIGISITISLVALCGWWLSGIAIEPVRNSYQRLKQFTADASHELRNPVAVIQTNAQVALADPVPNWDNQRQQLQVIERLTRRLGRLLEDLLFLARYDGAIVPKPDQVCDLSQILADVIEEQQPIAITKNISIQANIANIDGLFDISDISGSQTPNGTHTVSDRSQLNEINETKESTNAKTDKDLTLVRAASKNPVSMFGDRDRLMRLFTNLLSNAITYTNPGGSIAVSLKMANGGQAKIKIQDTGIGIPETELPHIFERFYRHQPQSKDGSGLGLAIAKAIVEHHQGQIKAKSTVGEGTTFTVILPLVKGI
ncbi:histidine kinase [Thalassoporum mexicanum PCC 7367]|uniref:sensor histidine kinase n=1 Tax=Thalassoporum mexicanum TaxID=3457544 RepID=UPI00029FBB1E|nr:HAMP domain-containing sensor histidine kinase [Pseudanabaena sp. PCC 7367]AFY71521.1 histidine kinase [Pseudanabaena sp. PCC 7367]